MRQAGTARDIEAIAVPRAADRAAIQRHFVERAKPVRADRRVRYQRAIHIDHTERLASELEHQRQRGADVAAAPQTRSKLEGDDGCQRHARQEVGSDLVVTGRDAAEVLQAAGGILGQVAALVPLVIVLDRALAVTTIGDDRNSPAFAL